MQKTKKKKKKEKSFFDRDDPPHCQVIILLQFDHIFDFKKKFVPLRTFAI